MRNKIDYGIDLGTTNSAIARMENGTPVIKKTDTLKDTLPSCINFNRKKDILVGDPAYNVLKTDSGRALKTFEKGKTNTFIEFKRTMGTTHTYECPNMGKNFTSEELSAEVLKKLKSFIQDETISSIVITVPAKFLNPQNEATMKAAKLAGFNQVILLQEPVAAATAYGLGTKNKDGYWLVFDFGGGTFDAALVKSDEGILSVKDTDGDNWLGGKNLDEAIVDQIIIPNLQENFAIDNILQDPEKREILRNAVKFYAEDAKIQLSFKDTYNILSNLGDLPFEDENGEEPGIDVLVTQKDMEKTLSPIFQKAIDIAKGVLKRNNLKGSDLGAMILVGGPTYSPILRRMIREQITDKVDTSVDPMTVVSKGATLFASTVSVSEEIIDEVRDKTKLQLDVKYEATTVQLEEMVTVKVLKEKTTGAIPDKIFVDIVRFDGAWSSGKIQIGEKAILIEVVLAEGCSNPFNILAYDDLGNKLECEPEQFNIIQGITGGGGGIQVLPYHIGIGKYFSEYDKDLFMPVKGLEKNKPVPDKGVTGVINGLKTRNELRPGMVKDFIRIPIYQGDHDAEGTDLALNNLISEVIITGETIPGRLPVGSDVDITIKVDRSQLMKFSAYFPLLNYTEELEIEIKQTETPKEDYLADEINKAKQIAERVHDSESQKRLEELDDQLENEKESADGKMRILDGIRKELLKLGDANKMAEWNKQVDLLQNAFYELENLINEFDRKFINVNKFKNELEEYRKQKDMLISEKPVDKLVKCKKLIDDMGGTQFLLLIETIPEAFIQNFAANSANMQWSDPVMAQKLMMMGLNIINTSYNREALSEIVKQLYGLIVGTPPPIPTGDGTLR